MKIAIVGAGAMGSLFGGLLARSGANIMLFDIWQEHVHMLNQHGLVIEHEGKNTTIAVPASTNLADIATAQVILLFVKSYHTLQAAQAVTPYLDKDAIVITLQNGVGNVETLVREFGRKRVLAGTTSFAATLLRPGIVRFAGVGENYIGELEGHSSARLQQVVAIFNRAGLTAKTADNVGGMIWSKMLINTGINALTALLHISNGEIVTNPVLAKISMMAIAEGIAVAEKKGIELLFAPQDKVKEVAIATKNNKSSMLQDIENGRKTEIMAINGAIWQQGAAYHVDTPVNKILTLLIQSLEVKRQGLQH